ncbi:MAG: hypothetical protein RL456_2725 [Pseudomonadota bacterium]|jgi:hypothetical protein
MNPPVRVPERRPPAPREPLDLLFEQIDRTPGVSLLVPAAAPSACRPPADGSDAQWGWYESQHGDLPGLEVTEHPVSPALCRAVFRSGARERGR